MPSRHYSRKMRSNSQYNAAHYILNSPDTLSAAERFPLEADDTTHKNVLDIVNALKQDTDISNITARIDLVTDALESKITTLDTLTEIENTMLSIIENITCGVPSGIISRRFEHMRKLANTLPDFAENDYIVTGMRIIEIVTMISKGANKDIVNQSLIEFRLLFKNEVEILNIIDEIHTILLSICDNITCGVPTGIITRRIDYLHKVLKTLPESEFIF